MRKRSKNGRKKEKPYRKELHFSAESGTIMTATGDCVRTQSAAAAREKSFLPGEIIRFAAQRRFSLSVGGYMREVLYEESANPYNLKTQKTLYAIYTVFIVLTAVISVLFFLLGFYVHVSFLIFMAFAILSDVLFIFLRRKIYYCVDLTFVSGSTRIVKVINYRRRKKIIAFEANEVVQVGKIGSDSYEKLAMSPQIKKIYATPNRYLEEGFYVQVNQGGINYLVLSECKEEYLQNLVLFTGRKVIEKDYK